MSDSNSLDFRPTARWEILQRRARLLGQVRRFFDERGFVEVETPLLSRDVVADLHLDPIPVTFPEHPPTPQAPRPMWLQTSPEFAMKRLLAAGADKIYQVTKAFRAGEFGAQHNPEFTIVEWYRVGDDVQRATNLLAELTTALLPGRPVSRISYEAAFQTHVGLNPHTASVSQCAPRAEALGLTPPASLNADRRDEWLNFLLATAVEPKLAGAVIVFDYPASQAALARTRVVPGDPPYEVAERFELYVDGVELANGYHELLDADTLRQRNQLANELRIADGRYSVPEESRLLAAMEQGLPACCGVALGFDRLVMVAEGAKRIQDVIAFPIDRA
jgi:lysyl-tRNA synthetase class 2